MNRELVATALIEAYSLSCGEDDAVGYDDMIDEYDRVINLLEKAIGECEGK